MRCGPTTLVIRMDPCDHNSLRAVATDQQDDGYERIAASILATVIEPAGGARDARKRRLVPGPRSHPGQVLTVAVGTDEVMGVDVDYESIQLDQGGSMLI